MTNFRRVDFPRGQPLHVAKVCRTSGLILLSICYNEDQDRCLSQACKVLMGVTLMFEIDGALARSESQ